MEDSLQLNAGPIEAFPHLTPSPQFLYFDVLVENEPQEE